MQTGTINIQQPINRRHPANRGIVSKWLGLNQGPYFGARALDLSSHNHGTLSGSIWAGSKGRIGGYAGLFFDGSDDFIDCGAGTNLQISEFTYLAWINAVDVTSDHAIIGWSSASGPEFRVSGSNLQLLKENVALLATSSGSVSTNLWTHVGISNDNVGNVVFYINGLAAGTASHAQTFTFSNFLIGKNGAGGSEFWNGLLDDVTVYDRILAADEIALNYAESRTGYRNALNWMRARQGDVPAAAGGGGGGFRSRIAGGRVIAA